jgi:hypothetical protein
MNIDLITAHRLHAGPEQRYINLKRTRFCAVTYGMVW